MDRIEYLLTVLSEESSEVIQAVTKALRFGLDEVYPVSGKSNLERLVLEYNDVLAVGEMLQEEGILPQDLRRQNLIDAKKAKVREYAGYSVSLGKLQNPS